MSEWIKCSERLPDMQTYALVCFSNASGVAIARFYPTECGPRWLDSGGREIEPSHWQPLPAPPKRESSFDRWFKEGSMPHPKFESYYKLVWDAAVEAAKKPDFVP